MNTAKLREICQKGGGEPFAISKFLYRPFTIHITRLYIAAGAASNTATLHSLVAGLAAFVCALLLSPWALLGVALFIEIYFILDHVDGELARYNIHRGRQQPSFAGEFFDLWTHLHTYNLVFAGLGFTLFRQTGQIVWFVLGLLAANISGAYQRLTLSTVLMGALARRRLDLHSPKYSGLLGLTHGQTESGAALSPQKKLLRLGSEIAIFPGSILGITIACVADYLLFIGGIPWTFFRALYLVVFCAFGLLSKIYRTRKTIRDLQHAAE